MRIMKIVTTPMCQEVVRLAGVSDYLVTRDLNSAVADYAIVLSETETRIPALKIKLNTFKQIYGSINLISDFLGTIPLNNEIKRHRFSLDEDERKKIKVKVYSNFLREIIEDMGFTIADDGPDFLVYPDYLKDELIPEIVLMGSNAVKIPSHSNSPLNPFERAQLRYNILEKRLCTKP